MEKLCTHSETLQNFERSTNEMGVLRGAGTVSGNLLSGRVSEGQRRHSLETHKSGVSV